MTRGSPTFDHFVEGLGGPRVLVCTEHVNATYYISFHDVLSALASEGRCSFAVLSQESVKRQSAGVGASAWARALVESFRPDVTIFSRYAQPCGEELQHELLGRGVPVVYHIDDDLLGLPESLGAAIIAHHGAAEVVEARRRLLARSDLIYASTAPLASVMRQRFPGKAVMSGMYCAYREELAGAAHDRRARAPGTVRLGYMGSKGHGRDLAPLVPILARLLEELPQVSFETFGTIAMPEPLRAFGDRVTSHKVVSDYAGFLRQLCQLDWDVGIAPLEDDSFNRCKAPTKFIEYTVAGIVTAASDLPVYSELIDGENGRLCGSAERWEAELRALLGSSELRQRLLERARHTCAETMSFARLKAQVEGVLSRVLRKSVT